jgi:GT2 family glycosyltransferase
MRSMPSRIPDVPWDVWVLDNGSTDGTADWLRRCHPKVRLVESPINLGFCAGYNRLVADSPSDWVALSTTTPPEPEWLGELVEALHGAPDDVAAVAGLIVDWTASGSTSGAA